jgi:hypothetical protein
MSVSNEQIYTALLGVKQDIGALNAKADVTAGLLNQHEARVCELEAGANRQRGAVKLMAVIATALGSFGGIVATLFIKGNHG